MCFGVLVYIHSRYFGMESTVRLFYLFDSQSDSLRWGRTIVFGVVVESTRVIVLRISHSCMRVFLMASLSSS